MVAAAAVAVVDDEENEEERLDWIVIQNQLECNSMESGGFDITQIVI